jgi:hypothetical protein
VADLLDRVAPYAIAGLGAIVAVAPLVARHGSVASIRATGSDVGPGAALAGFVLSVRPLYVRIAPRLAIMRGTHVRYRPAAS